jgi:hypothetical protein
MNNLIKALGELMKTHTFVKNNKMVKNEKNELNELKYYNHYYSNWDEFKFF